MPARAWLALPGSLAARVRGSSTAEPWIVPAAVRWLESRIRLDWRTLELGSGASTAWFAERCAEVISYEDDPSWHDQVRRRLDGVRNAEVRLVPLDRMPELISEMEPKSFDLVVVDCNENEVVDRMECLRAARDLVVPGGLLLLDDSDKESYRDQGQALEGWPVARFVGTKRFPLMAVETSIYRRPSDGSVGA